MASYNVMMTFETPGRRAALKSTHRLPGRAASMRLIGGDGMLSVSARVPAQTPTEAALLVANAVRAEWGKDQGPLTQRSWRAHRERVLLGRRRPSSAAWIADWPRDEGDEGGSAGVREPRRPLPGPGSLHAHAELPDVQER